MTPNIAIVRISNPYCRGLNVWLPLFLLWIPFLLLAPLLFLVLLAVCIVGRISFAGAIAAFWGIVCSLPGTNVSVRAQDNHVTVRIL